eukprot:GHRR01011475.1.p1 GENE.GHRR01011475.1~~GHRR01011475.1.p1  ORF type:complete len:315 (+),score=105.62 GHRR01011475.1:284-1228(+)
MVQVYQEPICRRHYACIASAAVTFRVTAVVAAVILSFLLAFSTGGFWQKLGHEVVQPVVHYSGDALMILESQTPGQELVWTTSAVLRAALPGNTLSANVQVGEEDYNQDGKPDMIRFIAAIKSPVLVSSLKLVLQFSYVLQGAARLRTFGLAYITAASPLAGSSYSADGQLLLQQLAPLSASGVSVNLNKPLSDSAALQDGAALQGDMMLQLGSLFSSYQARNSTTVFDNQFPVWKAGNSLEGFTVDVKIRIPPNQVHVYRPGKAEMLKWGWVQFICTFIFIWWLMSWLERFVFNYRVLETRVISDMQPRQQRF